MKEGYLLDIAQKNWEIVGSIGKRKEIELSTLGNSSQLFLVFSNSQGLFQSLTKRLIHSILSLYHFQYSARQPHIKRALQNKGMGLTPNII